jgi:hypothetical protein
MQGRHLLSAKRYADRPLFSDETTLRSSNGYGHRLFVGGIKDGEMIGFITVWGSWRVANDISAGCPDEQPED